jgi:trimeric autotransporter adhesin
MSTKTLRKRIALVAVSALGAGLLSVVAVPSANAVAGPNVAAGLTQTAAETDGVLNIATLASTTGSAVTGSGTHTAAASVGLVNVSDIAGGLVAGTTQTATLLSNGKLVVYTGAVVATTGFLITVEGGTLSCAATGATQAINGALTACAAYGAAGATDDLVAVVSPNSGATSMVVRLYTKLTATSAAAHVISSTKGDLAGQINVTIASSSTAGVLSTAKSGAYWVATYDAAAAAADTGSTGATDFGRKLYLSVRINDAYGSPLAAGNLITVSATGGAYVKINPGASDGGTQTSDYSVAAVDAEQVVVSNPTTSPMASTITISVGGTVIATRTAGFSGEVAKVVLSSPVIGQIGGNGSSGNTATYKLYDAANNAVYVDYSGSDNTTTPPQNLNEDTAVRGTVISSVARSTDFSRNLTTGIVTSGSVIFTCGASAGTGKISFIYTNTSGSIVKSNVLDAKCAGDAVSYTASYDKAKYAPGEIATLTVTFKDSNGNVANDIADVDTDTTGEITVSTAGMSQAINGPTITGTDGASISAGTLTYTYAVGTDEGTFTNRINVPDINTAGASISTAATSATLTVASSSTAISLADVLKAIVSLIASINKQIAALQKALLKK